MTVVYDAGLPTNQPQAHALIIGVGMYPYLRDGSGPVWAGNGGMGQLSSPPHSARALAQFLCENWTAYTQAQPIEPTTHTPLGSVTLLLSEQSAAPFTFNPPGQAPQTVSECTAATFRNISTAFDRWHDRLHELQENIGIFYFCGHGLAKGDLALLPEDFAASSKRPYETAININQTHLGMKRCQARTQLYFLDVCRKVTTEALQNQSFGGRGLLEVDLTQVEQRNAPIFYATEYGNEAFGRENQVSRFTNALLQTLQGAGATLASGNRWQLSTSSIGPCIHRILSQENLSLMGHRHQNAQAGGTFAGEKTLFVYPSPPTLNLQVSCQPPAANPDACFSLLQGQDIVQQRNPDPLAGAWRTTVRGGIYALKASFQQPHYREAQQLELLRPPSTHVDLNVDLEAG